MATNRKIGNTFETEFCELLFQRGFWCHNMAQNAAGQPADVLTTDSHSHEWRKISILLWRHGKPVEMARAGSHSRLRTKSL